VLVLRAVHLAAEALPRHPATRSQPGVALLVSGWRWTLAAAAGGGTRRRTIPSAGARDR
jgi:hypothetical protein